MKIQNYFGKLLVAIVVLSLCLGLVSVAGHSAEQSLPFVDVGPHDWFFDQVQHVFEQGIMAGTGAETFSPNMNVTRAMAVQVLYNHAGRPDVWVTHNPFNDIPVDAWYSNAVVWAAGLGIINGFDDGSFRPANYITRAHLTVMLNNFAMAFDVELPVLRVGVSFADDMDIRSYAREAIDRFFMAMIVNGLPDGRFNPHGNATRAELAAMLSGFIIYSENAVGCWDDGCVTPDYGFFEDDFGIQPPYGFPPDDDFLVRPMYGISCEE